MQYRRLYLDSPDLVAPSPGNAGYDIAAYGDYTVEPGKRVSISTGLAFALPEGTAGLILGRSGNAFRLSLYARHIGLLDPSYRGELMVLLENGGDKTLVIRNGDKVAQLLVIPFYSGATVEVDNLPETDRGASGFGSTGLGAVLKTALIEKG